MSGKVLQLESILTEDNLACRISEIWMSWQNLRADKINAWEEISKYVFATDTTTTSNSALPWKNKTTVPKLCQIRDNLLANYVRSLFPKRKWIYWEAYDKASADYQKKLAIESYMCTVVERSEFKNTITKLLLDWIDKGNCFAMPEWKDGRNQSGLKDQVGYVGPAVKRISPLDTIFNPVAATYSDSPKIIRSLVSLGEVKEMLERISTDENREANMALWQYMLDVRKQVATFAGEVATKDNLYAVDGFTSFQAYLESSYVEILTFYGDLYDVEGDKFYRNHIFQVVDRHKLLDSRENPSVFGQPNIFHCGWRIRPDNLWAMGPLDNLVGMQYRIDHLENLKADLFDLTAFPPLMIKGFVEDFEWAPMSRIIVGDDGEVELKSPDVNALNANLEIQVLEQKMEEMAGAPKEAMGFRTPGEKTKYEVQRLENAASRIFQAKLEQFEEQIIEPLLNAMLELARRNLSSTEIPFYDDEFKVTTFKQLTPQDVTGLGRLRPVAARHFAEQAEKVQNATAFFNSSVGMDKEVTVHISGLKLAEMFEELLELEGYDLVQPNIRLTEQADAQRLANSHSEQIAAETGTPSGLMPGDHSLGPPGPGSASAV